MAFFPLASAINTKGFCTVHNFPPNQWELGLNSKKSLWAIYSDGSNWQTQKLNDFELGDSKTYYFNELSQLTKSGNSSLILLQFRKTPLEKKIKVLPEHEFKYTKLPEWRSTVGFKLGKAQTSYQGEINPFPDSASLLTFHPFIQFNEVKNYLLIFNIEKSPISRSAELEIYNSGSKKLVDIVKIKNNHTNVVPLNKYNFNSNDLPVFLCRNMAGIPFGFGISEKERMLSLEHTHPPASFVVHGERYKVQSEIKSKWFRVLKKA
jgi:hypothetical protein